MKVLKWIRNLIFFLIGLAIGLLLFFTIIEYRPRPVEAVQTGGDPSQELFRTGEEMTIMTWNTGYGALGDNADFFMDGGTQVKTADRNRLAENLSGIHATIREEDTDIVFLQEVDVSSDRTYRVDEKEEFEKAFPNHAQSFARNMKAFYVPYPWPPLGHMDTGIMTLSKSPIMASERISLPVSFTWPVRAFNFKRCLLVNRYDLEDTDKQLVTINLHLEAYDGGEGKKKQTENLVSFMQSEYAKGNYVIVGGDFNQIFSNVVSSKWKVYEDRWQPVTLDVSVFGDDFTPLMDARVATCRSLDQPLVGADLDSFQFYVIDGFIVSANVAVMSVKTLDKGFACTDHNPVVMHFGLKTQQ